MTDRSEPPTLLWLLMMGVVAVLTLAGCGSAHPTASPAAVQASASPTNAGPTALIVTASPPSPTAAPATPAQLPPTRPATGEPTVAPTAAPTAAATPVRVSAGVSLGPPVRLVIPALKVDVPVTSMGWQVVDTAKGPVSQWVIPPNEAGHHINSASLGEHGNVVLSGHNNIQGRVFEAISRAWNDDTRVKVDQVTDRSDALDGQLLELYGAQGERFNYRIEEFYRLRDTGVTQAQREKNARFILPTADDRLTLVTCWPPWNNTHRLVLIARPASQP